VEPTGSQRQKNIWHWLLRSPLAAYAARGKKITFPNKITHLDEDAQVSALSQRPAPQRTIWHWPLRGTRAPGGAHGEEEKQKKDYLARVAYGHTRAACGRTRRRIKKFWRWRLRRTLAAGAARGGRKREEKLWPRVRENPSGAGRLPAPKKRNLWALAAAQHTVSLRSTRRGTRDPHGGASPFA